MSANSRFVLSVAALASISGFLLGFDIGLTSCSLDQLAEAYGLEQADRGILGLLVSAIFGGALVGAILASPLSVRLGRKGSIILCAVLFGTGALSVALSTAYAVGLAGKVLFGMAVGIASVIVPMYIAEISPPEIRGTALFFFQVAISSGLLASFGGFWLLGGAELWRWVCGVEIVLAIVLGIGMLRAPNSPRLLVQGGNEQEARNVLRLTLGRQDVEAEMDGIHESLRHGAGSWRDLLKRPYWRLTAIGCGLFFMQQASGVAAVTCFATKVFEAAGFVAGSGALFASTLLGVMNIASVIPGALAIDRLGRRKLLLGGSLMTILCLLVLGLSYIEGIPQVIDFRWVRLVCILAFVFFFTCSLGGVPWVMIGEVFPLAIRGAGMAVGNCVNWGMNLIVTGTYLTISNAIGLGATYFLYAGLTLISMVTAFLFLPETKDRPLEDIEANLHAGKPTRLLGDPIQRT